MSWSCSENENSTIQKSLVFDSFNVDQLRGHFAYIESEISDTIVEQEHVSVGLVSRSTARIRQKNCPVLFNAGDFANVGSGTLTSSTRFITALHVVNNEKSEDTIQVLFGTDHESTQSGDYVKDDVEMSLDFDPDYRSSIEEEEPFLAMRLFQLGLTKWAEKSNAYATEIRLNLRNWKFGYDDVEGGSKFRGQGFADLNGTNIFGEDIVVLKAIGTVAADEIGMAAVYFGHIDALVPSGFFLIDKPGVFFDYFPVGEWKGLDTHTPLWMEHANSWPGAKGEEIPIVRLISRPGFVEQGISERQIPDDCGGKHTIRGLVPTSLDGIGGSSGGNILAPNIHQQLADNTGNFTRPDMLTIGVLHGSRHSPNFSEEIWEKAGPASVDIDNVNYFTGISDASIPSRDTPETPILTGAPKACSEDQTENCIPCEEYNNGGRCIKTVREESVYTSSPGGEDLPIDPRWIPEDDESSEQERIGDRYVNCGFTQEGAPYSGNSYNQGGEYYPGAMVGIMGASKGKFGKEDFISDLYAICAPLSLESYTENWRFLYVKGSVLPLSISGIKHRRSWAMLNTISNEAYTINDNTPQKGHKFRPIAMKFCPPKYLMDGLDFAVTKEGITGVKSLHCRKPTGTASPYPVAGPHTLDVYLDASEAGVEGYTIFGEQYTLDQRIGNVNLVGNIAAGRTIDFRCQNNGFLVGLEMSHNANGVLDKFHPYCTPFDL